MAIEELNHCYACGGNGTYSIMLALTGKRIYLPNQTVRDTEPQHPGHAPVWFCRECMRAIEDNLRATILYIQSENR